MCIRDRVYGANASGKTNLALFFKFFKDSVCNGIPIEATQMFCKNRQENKERESMSLIHIWHYFMTLMRLRSYLVNPTKV